MPGPLAGTRGRAPRRVELRAGPDRGTRSGRARASRASCSCILRACACCGTSGHDCSLAICVTARLGIAAQAGGRAPAGGRTPSSRPGTRPGGGRAAPRSGSPSRRGRRGRARRPRSRRGVDEPLPRATRSPPGPGGWSARRAGAGRGRRPGGGPAPLGSAVRPTAPRASGRSPRPRSRGPKRLVDALFGSIHRRRRCGRSGRRRPGCGAPASSRARSRAPAPRHDDRRGGGRPEVRGGGERSSKCGLMASSPTVRARRRWTSPRSAVLAGRFRRSVVFPRAVGGRGRRAPRRRQPR